VSGFPTVCCGVLQGCLAVLVDAKDDHAKRYYMDRGFQEMSEDSLRLFVLVDTVRKHVKTSG
jgi:hypothetical protein